ncbi:MAG TPA: hypothetical protein DEF47_14155 [Herpetosiphon sp.]|nr:hypothetical protein [Herpetosiphon sp.]
MRLPRQLLCQPVCLRPEPQRLRCCQPIPQLQQVRRLPRQLQPKLAHQHQQLCHANKLHMPSCC